MTGTDRQNIKKIVIYLLFKHMTEQEKQEILRSMEKIFPEVAKNKKEKESILWEICEDAGYWDLFNQIFKK